jgi:hypothetical protein
LREMSPPLRHTVSCCAKTQAVNNRSENVSDVFFIKNQCLG